MRATSFHTSCVSSRKKPMNGPPDHRDRDPEEITGEKLHFDSVGYIYRAMSWLDYFERTNLFTALLYACIDARMGIEHLLFEELVMSTDGQLSREDYERCLGNRMKFAKLIQQLDPDHERLQHFTRAVLELMRQRYNVPTLVFWKPRELEKTWGKLSKYLHWSGAKTETTDKSDWLDHAHEDIRDIRNYSVSHVINGTPGESD